MNVLNIYFISFVSIFLLSGCSVNEIENSKKECNKGSSENCFKVAHNISIYSDYKNEAEEYYIKACELGNAKACNIVGLEQDSTLMKNYSAVHDYFKAFEYYEKACNKGNIKGCNNLGLLYEYGYGVTQNNNEAKKLYKKTCDANNAIGCRNLSIVICVTQPSEAKQILAKGCELKDETSCQYYRNWEINTIQYKLFGNKEEICGINQTEDDNYKSTEGEDKIKLIYHNRHSFEEV